MGTAGCSLAQPGKVGSEPRPVPRVRVHTGTQASFQLCPGVRAPVRGGGWGQGQLVLGWLGTKVRKASQCPLGQDSPVQVLPTVTKLAGAHPCSDLSLACHLEPRGGVLLQGPHLKPSPPDPGLSGSLLAA